MPRLAATNVAHTAITDHRILRLPQVTNNVTGDNELFAWREPPPEWRKRDLGLAYLKVGEAERSAAFIKEGFRLLYELPEESKAEPAVLAGLGSVYLKVERAQEALTLFQQAARLKPENAELAMFCGIAREATGDKDGAVHDLRRAIDLDPSLERAYFEISHLEQLRGELIRARLIIESYLKLFPQSLAGRAALDALQ